MPFSDIGPLQGPGCNIPSTGINDLTIETDTELDGIVLIEMNTFFGPSEIGYWMLVTGQLVTSKLYINPFIPVKNLLYPIWPFLEIQHKIRPI